MHELFDIVHNCYNVKKALQFDENSLHAGAAISVIFGSQAPNSLATVREMKYTSQHCCEKMAICSECFFPNCTKLW